MILFYTEHYSPRLNYSLDLIFCALLGLEIQKTEDISFFSKYNGIKIYYSPNEIKDIGGLYIQSHGLLEEIKINTNIDISIGSYNNIPTLFTNNNPNGVLPFDVFAAIFYLVTRYEEYNSSDLDIHGRFQAENSIAYKYNFLHIPIVNYYVFFLTQKIKEKHSEFNWKSATFSCMPTIDVDVAYEMYANDLQQHIVNLSKSFIRFKYIKLWYDFKIILGKSNDPNDTFDFIDDLHTKNGLKTTYFILFAKKKGYDINNNVNSYKFQSLLKKLSLKAKIGIHPSYVSFLNENKINKEKELLEKVIDKKISISRNHFLRNRIPDTYYNLMEAGIEEDFTMGYASQPGFRAGICQSYYFFDLNSNKATSLKIHPFMYMDGTLFNYLKINPAQGLIKINELVEETYKFGGQFISLWHNNTLADNKKFRDWRKVYKESIQYIGYKIKQ